nr:Clp protease N-terminal domain-containing protein [Saprospiraceae bacterium]
MNRKFSPKVKKIIQVSREEAVRLGHEYIGTEHLLLGILNDTDSLAVKVLNSMEIDLDQLKFKIEETSPSKRKDETGYNVGNIPLNKHAEKVLKVTFLEAKVFKNEEIRPEHLMLSILKHGENTGAHVLQEFEVDYDTYRLELEYVKQEM